MKPSAPTLTKLALTARLKTKVSVRLLVLLMLPSLLAACAQIPKSTVSEAQFKTLSCTELAQQTEQGKATKVVADQAKSDSWHAVMPIIVAARYNQAASASREAERRLTLLSEQSARLDCAR